MLLDDMGTTGGNFMFLLLVVVVLCANPQFN